MASGIELSENAKRYMRDYFPSYMYEPMRLYWEERLQPGGFLTAVLANDLVGACMKADDQNKSLISDYAQFLYWHVPGRPTGWGSPKAVEDWINGRE